MTLKDNYYNKMPIDNVCYVDLFVDLTLLSIMAGTVYHYLKWYSDNQKLQKSLKVPIKGSNPTFFFNLMGR